MAFLHKRPGWEIPESRVTPEGAYLGRRRFLGTLGIAGAAAAVVAGCGRNGAMTDLPVPHDELVGPPGRYPAQRNPKFKLDRELTSESVAAVFNNFYEFTDDKTSVWQEVGKFKVKPWQVRVDGLCAHPKTFELDELLSLMPLEERLYRMRCVETWAMAVPWTGFPLKALLDKVQPLGSAAYVRFLSFHRPAEAPGQAGSDDEWPYYEGLTIAEAANELTIMACGIYGHELPKQHGAPLRLVAPWKYGFKSAKSITRIELIADQPRTFWSDKAPRKYDFVANVDPALHKPWFQGRERMLGTREVRPTLPFNGYGEWVAGLYS